jgi:anti-sigma regulatory factor (Ser/Thr protein kinase)
VSTAVAERAWCASVPHHPIGAGIARRRMSAELSGSVRPALLADAVAIIAELVGNAIRHAEPLPGDVVRIAWRLRTDPDAEVVTITVTDGGAAMSPTVQPSDLDAVDGRGLAIVEALADYWGFERDGLGQSVWAEVGGLRACLRATA